MCSAFVCVLFLGYMRAKHFITLFVCFGRLADVPKAYSNLNNKVNLLEKQLWGGKIDGIVEFLLFILCSEQYCSEGRDLTVLN